MGIIACMGRPLGALVVVVALLGGAGEGVARAGGVSPLQATAKQHDDALARFQDGKKAADARNWSAAITAFRASLDIVDSPNTRLLLARALRDSDASAEAWTEYGRVIDDGNILAAREPNYTKTVDAAMGERSAIEAKLAFVIVSVAHEPKGATVRAGGRNVPSEQEGSPFVVAPGAVDVVVVDPAGKELARKTVTVALGDKTQVNLDAAAPAPPPGPAPPPDKDDTAVPNANPDDSGGAGGTSAAVTPGSGDRSSLRPWAYVAGGVGVAGLVTFTVAGLMNNSTYDDLKNTCPHGCYSPTKKNEESTGRTEQTIANVGLGVGIVGLAAGTALFLLSRPSNPGPPSTGAALVVGPGYLGVRGSL